MKQGKNTQQTGITPSTTSSLCQSFILQFKGRQPRAYTNISSQFSQVADRSGNNYLDLPCFIKDKKTHIFGFMSKHQQIQAYPSQKITEENLIRNLKALKNNSPDILVAKPKNKFCFVCKIEFVDYLRHINGQSHRQNVKQCQISRQVRQFTNKYFSSHRRPSISDYQKDDIQVGRHKPTKKRAIQQTPSLVPGRFQI